MGKINKVEKEDGFSLGSVKEDDTSHLSDRRRAGQSPFPEERTVVTIRENFSRPTASPLFRERYYFA